jgi:5,5'-dehydrodivanillate O-demethylase
MYYGMKKREPGEAPKDFEVERREVMWDERGLVDAPQVIMQDEMGWIGQGHVSDRTLEHLVTSDKGIMMMHNMLLDNIARVERGEDPTGVVRDEEINFPQIDIRIEGVARQPFVLAGAR